MYVEPAEEVLCAGHWLRTPAWQYVLESHVTHVVESNDVCPGGHHNADETAKQHAKKYSVRIVCDGCMVLKQNTWHAYIRLSGKTHLTVRVGLTRDACLGHVSAVVHGRDILIASDASAVGDAAGPGGRVAVQRALVAHAGPAPVARLA